MNDVALNPSTATAARQCAVKLLAAVLDEKRPLDEAFARLGGIEALDGRDRNFVYLMVITALRRKGQIDALLAPMLAKPLTGKLMLTMHCLRLGAVQLLFLETPAHAAVHAMVETIAALGAPQMKGLVNAVLKRVATEGPAIMAKQDAAMLNLPEWFAMPLVKEYGETVARGIGEARLMEPPLDITVKSDAEDWAKRLGGVVLPTGSVRLAKAGRVEEMEGFAEGQWWVQDAAAALPVKLLGDVRGLRVLDVCAAPGGKTAQLAALGAQVTALDKSARRLRLLEENLKRLSMAAEIVEADALRYRPETLFDVVLLDAPCSATGTLRRHPEVIWHKTLADVEELAGLQRKLLNRAAGWVKPGGKLLYCVCSLARAEGEAQGEAFAAGHGNFSIMPAPEAFGALGLIGPDGGLRTHPAMWQASSGMDGFYAICWQRLKDS